MIESSPGSPALIEDKVKRGELGVKSGAGFYPWTGEDVEAFRGKIGRALAAIDRLSREE